ncbi:MAG: hypothetical protein NTW59_02560 [Candidatus Diapherotrites archaeon]|nr:hypothetical protein [Candidatus Diapherotrites archaeon]
MSDEPVWNRNIQIIGLPDLDEVDSALVQQALEKTFDKMRRVLKEDFQLVLHFKEYNKGGAKTKHSIHVRVIHSGKPISAQEVGWNAVKTAQHALAVLEREAIEQAQRKKG